MNFISTNSIPRWPSDIFLATREINHNLSPDVLSKEEREEYESISLQKRKSEYLTARHLFYEMAAKLFDEYHQVKLMKSELGKPYAKLDDTHLYVSFSHSKKMVMCALSTTKDIGIDIERSNRPSSDELLKRMLCPEEHHLIDELEPMELWTIKEAAVKRAGIGLRLDLHKVKIHKKANRIIIRFNDEKTFEVRSFKSSEHTVAVVF